MAATLYDAYGHQVDLGRLREEVAAPSLTSIRQVWSDHVAVGLTPQRLANLLKASEQGDPSAYLSLAEEMEEKDLHYRAQLGTRKLGCAGLPLVVEAASDAKDDQVAADLVREVLGREDMEDILVDALDALGKGFSVCELIWETSGKQWVPREILWRDPRWFGFDLADGRTVKLLEAGGQVDLPPFKFIVHQPKLKSGLPIRGGLARASAWAYLFANYALKDWVAFLEIFGQPLRVGKYPAGAGPEQIAILETAVRNIGSDAAAVIPDGMVLEFIETKVSGSADGYERLLRYLDGRVTLAVLGQTLTSGQTQGGGGSLALGQVHNEVRTDLKKADAKQLMGTFHRDLVRPLVDLNLGPRKVYPKVRLQIDEAEDLAGLTAALKELVPLGLEVEQSVIRDKFGLPDPGTGPDVKLLGAPKPPQTAPPAPAPATAAQSQCLHCGSAHAQGQPDALDGLVASALSNWVPQVKPLVGPLIQAIQSATTYDELKVALAAAAQQMDPAALAETLAQAGFMAGLAGDTGVPLAD
jgi:phage gp29-like protein